MVDNLYAREVIFVPKYVFNYYFVNMSTTRRLAAATGYPYGIDDAFIVLEYPADQPGFSSSQPIRTNARIARVTSRILIGINPVGQTAA